VDTGCNEKIYENCLCVEFRLRGISYNQQERYQLLYKGELVGDNFRILSFNTN